MNFSEIKIMKDPENDKCCSLSPYSLPVFKTCISYGFVSGSFLVLLVGSESCLCHEHRSIGWSGGFERGI